MPAGNARLHSTLPRSIQRPKVDVILGPMSRANENQPITDSGKRHAGVSGVKWINTRFRRFRLAIRAARRCVEQAVKAEAELAKGLCRGQRIMILMTLVVGLWQGVAGFLACFVMAVTTYILATRGLT